MVELQLDISGEKVLSIESAFLAGQDIAEERAAVIRGCVRNLLSSVIRTADNTESETHPPTNASQNG